MYFNSEHHLCKENGEILFTNHSGSFDFVVNFTDERTYYDQEYGDVHNSLSTDEVLTFSYLRELWDREPCQKLLLDSLGDLNGKKMLLLGNGTSRKELYFLCKGAKIVYTDLSWGAIECVKKHVDSQSIFRGYLKNIEFHSVDALHTPFCNAEFDVIYGYGFVHHIRELDEFSREVFRCLKPGGICRFFDDGYSPMWQTMKNTILQPLQLYSHRRTGISPEDEVATKIGGFRREQIEGLGVRLGFDDPIYQKISFFEYLLNRGTEKLGFMGLRFLQPFLRCIDNYLLHNTRFIARHGIRLVWGFEKPNGVSSKG